jgi:DegV family protein with EDD domain
MTIGVVTDSTCDLPAERAERLGIKVMPLYINVGAESYSDGVDITRDEFYRRLPDWETPPTTAVPGPNMFREMYVELAGGGATEILSLHVAESLSGTVNVARLAAKETTEVPVTVVDSQQLSLGTGFLAETAAKAAAEGQAMAEILALVEEQIARTHVFAALDTLEFLRRSGRMSWAVARIGRLLDLKPILRMYNGEATADKVRTRAHAWARMIAWLEELAPLERVALVHTNALDRVQELRDRVQHLLPEGETLMANVTPVLGAHLGPGAVGLACVQAPR